MKLLRQKRGLNQADWAMSLGIFLIYLAWFFVIIKPAFGPDTKESLPIDQLKESFLDDAFWYVNNTPLIIISDIVSDDEPIIAEFPFEGDHYLGTYSIIDEGYLFFFKSLEKKNYAIPIIYSGEDYVLQTINSNLESSEEFSSNKDIKVIFENGMMSDVYYKNSRKIESFNLLVDGRSPSGSNHISNKIFGKHKVSGSRFNHSTYVFDKNSRIYGLISSSQEKFIDLEFTLDTYDNYFSDNFNYGSINYNSSGCEDFESDFIDFYDDDSGVSFIFDQEVMIEVCNNNSLNPEFEFYSDGDSWYKIIFHDRQDEMRDHIGPYETIIGVPEMMKGLSEERLFNIENSTYEGLKREWGISYDFNITVIGSSGENEFSIGTAPYDKANIYAQSYNTWLLDKTASMERVMLVILMW